MVLILNRDDMIKILSMKDTMKAVENAFSQLYKGKAKLPLRTQIETEKGSILYMPCYLDSYAIKVVSVFPQNKKRGLPTIFATVQINDPDTGKPQAIMEGGYLTAMRTGATSGVATKYLARKDSTIAGVIGTGVQARTQLWAVCEVRNIEKALVYDVNLKAAKSFAGEMSKKLGIEISIDKKEETVKNSDILILATTSQTPVINGSWIEGKMHINSVGWAGPNGRELDSETVKISKLFVDSKEAVLKESGDIIIPIKEKTISADHIRADLSELVVKKTGRTDDGITLFKSVGLAIEDAAAAKLAHRKALKEGVGLEVKL